MKRWISILFLVLLPLQFGWAAVGAYCQHETGPGAQHFGHHDYQHRAESSGDESDKPSKQQAGAAYGDCASCHADSAAVILETLVLPQTSVSRTSAPSRGALASGHPSEPERPNWSTPA